MKTIVSIKYVKSLFTFFFALITFNSQAVVTHTLQDNTLHAKVNDWHIPSKSVTLFHQYALLKNPELTQSQLLKNIIENRLLADHAKQYIGLSIISDETKVGFKQKHATQAQLINVLKSQYQTDISHSISQLQGGNLKSVITTPLTLSKLELNDLFTMTKTMEYTLSHHQKNILKGISLLNFQFPKAAEQTMTLWDIYERTNMQEKISLFKGDTATLKKLTYQHLSSLYVLHFVKHFTNISDNELANLKQFITDNRIARQFQLYSGAKTAVHHSNQALRNLSKQVSQQEIEQYYQAHKETFKTIKKVKARHIQLASQSQADKVYQALKEGLNFNDAIKQYSQATDKHQPVAGSLGWINRKEINGDWLRTLPFTQKTVGTFSAPFMSPKKHFKTTVWEIVYLDDQVVDYLDPTSKTVQYNASKSIAKIKINQSVSEIKQQLWHEARVNINNSKISSDLFNHKTPEFNLFETGHQHSEPHHGH